MIYILGDIHAEWNTLMKMTEFVNKDDTVIQVGDFGIYDHYLMYLRHMFPDGFPCKVLVVDGNHEDFNIINGWSKDEPTEFHKNFFFVPRGYVTEIEGELFGFLGGAESIGKAWGRKGVDWFDEGSVQPEDVEKLVKNIAGRQLDVLITHSPPEFVNRVYFPPLNKISWGLAPDWIDLSAVQINKAHWALRPKKHYCGHMHGSINHDAVRIVDIDEIVEHKRIPR